MWRSRLCSSVVKVSTVSPRAVVSHDRDVMAGLPDSTAKRRDG
jgi:hypothetical protein